MWTSPIPRSGYFPKVNWPWVASGNLGVFLSHVPTGVVTQLPSGSYPHGWMDAATLRCSEMQPDPSYRILFDVGVPGFGRTNLPELRPGWQEIRSSLGHTAAWDVQGQIWYDGAIIGRGYHGIRQHGCFVAARSVADGYALHVFYDGSLLRTIPKQAEVYDWAIIGDGPEPGAVVYGYPKVFLSYPSGAQRDITRSAWCEGATSGGGMKLVNVDGILWLWTVGQTGPAAWGVIGGPVTDPAVMLFDLPASWFDVQHQNRQFHIAACDDQGTLRVETVEDTAYRGPMAKPAPAPVPDPPSPPAPEPVPTPEPVPVPVPDPGPIVPIPGTKPKPWWRRLLDALLALLGVK